MAPERETAAHDRSEDQDSGDPQQQEIVFQVPAEPEKRQTEQKGEPQPESDTGSPGNAGRFRKTVGTEKKTPSPPDQKNITGRLQDSQQTHPNRLGNSGKFAQKEDAETGKADHGDAEDQSRTQQDGPAEDTVGLFHVGLRIS